MTSPAEPAAVITGIRGRRCCLANDKQASAPESVRSSARRLASTRRYWVLFPGSRSSLRNRSRVNRFYNATLNSQTIIIKISTINTDFFQGEQALFDLPCRDFQGSSLQLDRKQASSDFALGTWAKVAAPVPLPGALGLPAFGIAGLLPRMRTKR